MPRRKSAARTKAGTKKPATELHNGSSQNLMVLITQPPPSRSTFTIAEPLPLPSVDDFTTWLATLPSAARTHILSCEAAWKSYASSLIARRHELELQLQLQPPIDEDGELDIDTLDHDCMVRIALTINSRTAANTWRWHRRGLDIVGLCARRLSVDPWRWGQLFGVAVPGSDEHDEYMVQWVEKQRKTRAWALRKARRWVERGMPDDDEEWESSGDEGGEMEMSDEVEEVETEIDESTSEAEAETDTENDDMVDIL